MRLNDLVPRILVLIRQGMMLAHAPHVLRWRLETFGLYMPSLPEARPWWRINYWAARAMLRQMPGYMRWLAEMQALRRAGARGWWRTRSGTDADKWEQWLHISDQ